MATTATRMAACAALLLAIASVALCSSSSDSSHQNTDGLLLEKLRRVSRSPQLPNPQDLAEKARDMAKSAREMAQQHITERVADLKDKVEAARGAAASIQSGGVQLPSSVTSMANNS
ncbi:hypothetical protein FOCC_FOCC017256 [Frankliniella occidentalis]|uniref:Uncharacterized protein LOC113212519 isoform X1 n=1 Tax=Frankliniella occidentalis TaxID=133901 RepID=A0A9C6XAF2_FRAOC|nr:uncharacterized protein LOC113212519 isoform X1 [Frankliniella occidentalis]KAE8737283.1 hypothetical protein FOCC_FOCC017256 [Frankliniella occidentalis]